MSEVPDPFPIPKFRISTDTNFEKKILTDTDRKYVVQTLTTMLMTHIQKPSLHDCSIVAKSLIRKHQFLKDDEGDGQVCISVAIIIMFLPIETAFLEVVSLLSIT